MSETQLPRPRVALALGRGITPEGESNSATDTNAVCAFRLLERGMADLLVLSGGYSAMMPAPPPEGFREARNMLRAIEDYAEKHPAARRCLEASRKAGLIILEERSGDTLTNMTETKALLARASYTGGTIMPVSVPHAGKRALYAARKVFGHPWEIGPYHASDYAFPEGLGERRKVILQEAFLLGEYMRGLRRIDDGDHEAVLAWHGPWQERTRSRFATLAQASA